MDLTTERVLDVDVDVVTDLAALVPRTADVASRITSAGISPTGQRAVFEARGEIFTVPARHGAVRNLTHSSGAADRFPAWSPDGRWIASWSDSGGEYELTLHRADGTGEPRGRDRARAGVPLPAVLGPRQHEARLHRPHAAHPRL